MFEIRLRPESEQDLADAAAWYEEQRPGLGHEFPDEVEATLSSIAETPLMYPGMHRNTRRAVIHRFPFSVYFHTDSPSIIVIAIMHGSRNPRRWKNR